MPLKLFEVTYLIKDPHFKLNILFKKFELAPTPGYKNNLTTELFAKKWYEYLSGFFSWCKMDKQANISP